MLNQVSHLAIEAPGGYIDEGIRRAIVAQCDRCQEPDLADAQGVRVLMIEDLDYCARLRGLHDKATSTPDPEPPIQTGEILPPEEIEERKKAGSRRRWETIAQELESFPNAVPVTQD